MENMENAVNNAVKDIFGGLGGLIGKDSLTGRNSINLSPSLEAAARLEASRFAVITGGAETAGGLNEAPRTFNVNIDLEYRSNMAWEDAERISRLAGEETIRYLRGKGVMDL